MTVSSRLGLIAGSGDFPLWVLKAAAAQGHEVHVLALTGWASPQVADGAASCTWLKLGELQKLLDTLRQHQIATATLAGKVTKEAVLGAMTSFDSEALRVLARAATMQVNGLLGAVATRLAQDGVTLVEATRFLQAWLPEPGTLTRREPTSKEWDDIWVGQGVAKALAGYDIGQTVVVKRGVVLAVEASDATDATIRRAGELGDGDIVVVKMARPKQDMRFDVPVVGLHTLESLRAARATCLAVEARKTLLLERETLITQANAAGLSLVAV